MRSATGSMVTRWNGFSGGDMKQRSIRRHLFEFFLALGIIVLVTGLAMGVVHQVPFVRMMDNWTNDFRIATLAPPEPQHPDIIIISITEQTLARFPYRSPIDRGFLADLIASLAAKGVRGLFLDVLLDQPTEKAKDAALKKQLRSMTIPVVVSYGLDETGNVLTRSQMTFLNEFLPVELRGFANLVKDTLDETVRWIYPGARLPDGRYVMGSTRALAHRLGVTTPEAAIPISWRGSPDRKTAPFKIYPAHVVPLLPAAWFKDRIALIGVDITLTDRHRTPFSLLFGMEGEETRPRGMPGVMIHAHGLAQILDDRPHPGLAMPHRLLLTAAAALLGSLLARAKINLYLGVALEIILLLAFWTGGLYLFHAQGVLLPLLAPTLGSIGGFWLTRLYIGSRERQEGLVAQAKAKRLRKTFGRYMSTEVADTILDTANGMRLGGEKKEVTVMMTDLRGFTAMSEKLPPEEVVAILNRYLEVMTEIITRYHGTIIEFLGDGILVLFGAPVTRGDDPQRAVACALEMQRAMVGVNESNRPFGYPELKMGGGINTGTVVAGNIGSEKRSKYGVVGTTINLTARIESYTVGGQILISESTRRACGDLLRIDDILQVKPKGIPEPIHIYHVGAIGPPYDVALPEPRAPERRPIAPGLTVRFTVVTGKSAGEMDLAGTIVGLAGEEGVVVRSTARVDRLTNLKLALYHHGEEVSRELYGKVTGGGADLLWITFTSLPAEAKQRLADQARAGEMEQP